MIELFIYLLYKLVMLLWGWPLIILTGLVVTGYYYLKGKYAGTLQMSGQFDQEED